MTVSVGVPNVSLWTQTLGVVADDDANGTGATSTWTRIAALLVDAKQRQWTVTAHNTFRPTLNVWIAYESFQTRAHSTVV